MQMYLVTDIKFEEERISEMVPTALLADVEKLKTYLRTMLFYTKEVTFNIATIESVKLYTRNVPHIEFDRDIFEKKYNHFTEVEIITVPKRTCLINVSDEQLVYSEGNLNQAAFEILNAEMDLDFIIL